MTKKIIFSSGGTGGHMFPAINLMKYFSNKGYKTLLVTDVRCSHLLKKNPELNSRIIKTDTPTNKNFIKKILSFIVIFFSLIKSILILKKEKPNIFNSENIRNIYLSSTMGISFKLKFKDI